MSDLSNSLGIASSGMQAQSARLRLVAENMANTDTPGYRRKTASFEQMYDGVQGAVKQSRVELDRTDLPQVFDPSHPMADESGYVRMSNVSLAVEIADAREAQRSYEANISIFDQARRMYGGVLDLLRR